MAVIAAQLGAILALVWAFNVENPAFARVVLPLAFGGFLVHHWLPRRYQPLFFAALSLAGIGIIFGLVAGAWLIGVGLGLIALCHLPIPFRARVVVIVLAAGVLLAMRSTWLPTPWPGVIWPILGSMFMFRLAVYLYDLKHYGPAAPGMVLSYFFLLPNTVFLLFPIIDFQTFRRTHYDKPAFGIYDEGVRWMFRGLTHLVLYRVIYQYVALSPAEVTSTASLVQYAVGNYGLYLRVSGQFHMIVGLLHLFGFRLPETHRFFYLASSFSDMWRRINIYWKDFMQKLVYLPMIFRLKHLDETPRLVGATLVVVGVTWFLHSYQWFWLLGEWLFSATDLVFWGILGACLLANTLREQRRGRVRQLTAQKPAASYAWRQAFQTAGMFTFICSLWVFWTSPTFADFQEMMSVATLRPIDVVAVLGTFGSVAAVAYLVQRFSLGVPSALAVRPRWQHPLLVGALPLALFWAAGEPAMAGRLPTPVQELARQARVVELNKQDADRLQRGYYEKIVGVNRFNGELWEVYARAGQEQVPELLDTGLGGFTYDEHGNRSYHPFVNSMFKGGKFQTNRWGFRDQDYEKIPPPKTQRFAVLGPSYVVGSGVNNGEPFEQVAEDRLNAELSSKTGFRYEFLNFGMSTLNLAEMANALESGRIAEFRPNVAVVVGHKGPLDIIGQDIWRRMQNGQPLPRFLGRWLPPADLAGITSQAGVMKVLRPHEEAVVREALVTAATAARRMGATPVYALIPMPAEGFDFPEKPTLLGWARDAGFVVIDMQNVFEPYDQRLLILNPADFHPNAEGHRILAGRLVTELLSHPELLVPNAQGIPAPEVRAEVLANESQRAAEMKAREPAERARRAWQLSWAVETHQGSKAIIKFPTDLGGPIGVTISNLAKPVGWHVKLRQASFALTEGHDYHIAFRARAAAPRAVAVGAERNVAPWSVLGFYKTFDVGTAWAEYDWTFTANATEANARIFFDLGASTEMVEVSNVVLRDVATGKDLTPTVGPVVRKRR